eukprot:COSAG02_NODE_424_length_22575_cov_79.088361_11_plen_183_part_00
MAEAVQIHSVALNYSPANLLLVARSHRVANHRLANHRLPIHRLVAWLVVVEKHRLVVWKERYCLVAHCSLVGHLLHFLVAHCSPVGELLHFLVAHCILVAHCTLVGELLHFLAVRCSLVGELLHFLVAHCSLVGQLCAVARCCNQGVQPLRSVMEQQMVMPCLDDCLGEVHVRQYECCRWPS